MVRRSSALLGAVAVALVAGPSGAGSAENPTETRLREALRSAQTQLRALEDERAKWQETEAELRKELEAAKKEVAPAPKHGPSERAVWLLNRRIAEQESAAAGLKESLAKCESASREASSAARLSDAERARLKAEAAALGARLAASERKNEKMFAIGKEIIDWVSNIGARVESEPVLGLRRVELENIAQDYDDKLLEERVRP